MKTTCSIFIRLYFAHLANGFIFQSSPVANTDCGLVRGVSLETGGPYSFRGIPYASPPSGNLRWRPPLPTSIRHNNCWRGIFNATNFGNICYQRRRNDTSQYFGSEDCLYLNVWTSTLNKTAQLPVAVWLHGGYLETGNGNEVEAGFSPTEQLAKETNTVFVSLNYRLQAFGFMSLQWLADNSTTNSSGNYGFMDMIEALKWVQRNIGNFGGDSNQVNTSLDITFLYKVSIFLFTSVTYKWTCDESLTFAKSKWTKMVLCLFLAKR